MSPAGGPGLVRPWTRGPRGLSIGGVALRELVERAGSPLFVMCGRTFRERARRMRGAFADAGARLYLAGKANPNPAVWLEARAEGFGLDACSPGEVEAAQRAGFADEEISFTGCALTPEDMDQLAATRAHLNLDAGDQALAFAARHPGRAFGLRVNPGEGAGSHASCTTAGSDTKLGVPWHEVRDLVAALRERGAAFRGLHCHTGSGGLDAEHFVRTARRMEGLAKEVGDLDWLSLGGGIGVPHHPDDPPFDLDLYAREVARLVAEQPGAAAGGMTLQLEPGQGLVAECGVLVVRVVCRKEQADDNRFVLVDSSFNHYLGTSLYGSHHEIEVDHPEGEARPAEVVHVCGHLCNTGDVFARARELPVTEVGDLLVMATCGAYGLSRAANYNTRPIPAEVWVEEGEVRRIRRRQTVAELAQWYEDVPLAGAEAR